METHSIVLTFQYVDERLWCEHSYETCRNKVNCFSSTQNAIYNFGIFRNIQQYFFAISVVSHALPIKTADVVRTFYMSKFIKQPLKRYVYYES